MILKDIAYCLVYAVIELILLVFTQKSPPCLKNKKKKKNPDTYAINWTLL